MLYDVCLEYTNILAGTDNQYSKAYLEVSKNMESSKDKNMKYVENFITSIEEINKKCGKESRISSSKGNIKDFKGYKDITTIIDYFKTSGASVEGFKDLVTIKDSLESNQALYTEAYNKGVRIIILEYESALYMLVTGLSLLMATNVDVSGDKILIQKKTGASGGVILKTCKQFAKELSGSKHKDYLDGLLKVNDSSKNENLNEAVFYEDMAGISVLVASTITLVDNFIYHITSIPASIRGIARSIKKTFFGIIPLIRCGLYIRYKKKADTISALEQQADFLQKNIDRLKRRTNMDPKEKEVIIKKQEAYVKAYLKKAEKLRAQLMETEKDASSALAKEDPKMSDISSDKKEDGPTDDGDFILEGVSIRNHFKKGNKSLSKAELRQRRKEFKPKNVHGSKSFRDTSFEKDSNKNSDIDKIIDEIISSTKRDTISFTLKSRLNEDNDPKGRMKSKIGGIPYWPKNKEWPMFKGTPMMLLAQINFAEVPKLSGYPSSGILQFFTGDVDYWSNKSNPAYKAVYFEKPDSNIEQLEDIPNSSCMSGKRYSEPVEGVFYIDKFTKEKMSIQWNDDEFEDIAKEILKKHPDINVKTSDIMYRYDEKYPTDWGHRIGGWASHVQWGISVMDNDNPKIVEKYNTLLLQIDTESSIIWGDCGIANIFINDKALANKDFSDVLFYYDCG